MRSSRVSSSLSSSFSSSSSSSSCLLAGKIECATSGFSFFSNLKIL